MSTVRINPMLSVDREALTQFCQRWRITELALFGSARGDDFRPDSDVDILASFAPDANWGLFDQVAMEAELSSIVGRPVDLVSRRAVERSENWIRRAAILDSAEPFYVAHRARTRHVLRLSDIQEASELHLSPSSWASSDRDSSRGDGARRTGTPVSPNDLWIAASAAQHGLTVVTLNRDFDRIPQVFVRKLQAPSRPAR